MIKRFLIVGRREIHLTKTVFCKSIFNGEETEKILSVVNNSNVDDLISQYVITETRAKKLQLSRERSGKNLDSIDEILEIGGFSGVAFNKFCKSILNEESLEKGKMNKSRNRSYTLPPISNNLIQHIHSFTSIHCGMVGISWSKFEVLPNENTKVTHWGWKPIPESKLNLYHLAAFMTNALKDVPKSDFYIFENPIVPNAGSTSNIGVGAQITQMIGMASVIAAQNNTLPIVDGIEASNIAYLRRFLFARLFKLNVGTERITTTNYVENWIRLTNISAVMDEDTQSQVDMDSSLKYMYTASERVDKDFLGCSFLLGLAFLRLCLLKCPISTKLIKQ